MGHTAPDWSWMGKVSTIYSLQDQAELAARLGSIVTFDRRGNVVWLDDFESGLGKWTSSTTGTGSEVALAVTTARSGAYSCKLGVGSTAGALAQIAKLIPFPVLGKIGIEFSFAFVATDPELSFWVNLYDGTYRLQPQILYKPASNKLYYVDDVGNQVELAASLVLHSSAGLFHTTKLFIDLNEREYVGLVLDEESYSLADIAIQREAATANPRLEIWIKARRESGTSGIIYVDDVIVTQNEP